MIDDNDEDERMPESLPERWALRDSRYVRGWSKFPLGPAEIAAIRELRVGEAEELGDRLLIRSAQTWRPPR